MDSWIFPANNMTHLFVVNIFLIGSYMGKEKRH